ncbi:MAG: hypothetical protein ACTTIV_03910 [Campylobacter sp.]
MKSGGLASLGAMTIVCALPFIIALLGAIFGMMKALRIDVIKKQTQNLNNIPLDEFSKTWQERLRAIIMLPSKKDALKFIDETACDAFEKLRLEFEKNGLETKILKSQNFINLCVLLGDERDFYYGIKLTKKKKKRKPDYSRAMDGDDLYYRAEVFLKEGGQDYDVLGWSETTLINDIVEQYRRHMQFLHTIRV